MLCLAQVEFIPPSKETEVKWQRTFNGNCFCCGTHISGDNVREKGNWAYCNKCLSMSGRCCKNEDAD